MCGAARGAAWGAARGAALCSLRFCEEKSVAVCAAAGPVKAEAVSAPAKPTIVMAAIAAPSLCIVTSLSKSTFRIVADIDAPPQGAPASNTNAMPPVTA
jgi:hypothetical protein